MPQKYVEFKVENYFTDSNFKCIFIYIYYICSQSCSFCFTILQTTKTHSEEAFKFLPLLFFVFKSEFRLGIRVARLTVLYWLFLNSGPNLRFFALK